MFPRIIRTMIPGPVPAPCSRVRDDVDRVQQGDLRGLPRAVGGRDVGARADARRRRPRARDRPRRDPAAQHDRARRAAPPRWSPDRRSTCGCRPARRSSRRSSWPTSSTGRNARPRRAPRAGCSGSGSPPTSRPRPGRPASRSRSCPGWARLIAGEPARTVLEADGTVTVHTQQMPHGQGHETTLAQVAADELGVPIEQVRVRFGDTRSRRSGCRAPAGAGRRRWPGGAVTYSAAGVARPASSTSPPICSRRARDDLVVEEGGSTWRACRRSRCRSPTSPRAPCPASRLRAGDSSPVRRRRGRLGPGDPRLLGRGRPRHRAGAHRPLRRGRGLR